MAKKTKGKGFVFNLFSIGITVFMFVLPTIVCGYIYYYYIRVPDGAQPQQEIVVAQQPRAIEPSPKSFGTTSAIESSGIFTENPTPVQPISPNRLDQPVPTFEGTETQPKPERNLPKRDDREMRTWSDPSGKFSVEAKFYSASGTKIKLATSDDRKIEVDVSKLCDADKEYLRALFKSKGIRASF